MNRAIVVVLDGVGAGTAPDADQFNDLDQPSTLLHTWEFVKGFNAPNLASIGFLAAGGIPNAPTGMDDYRKYPWGRIPLPDTGR